MMTDDLEDFLEKDKCRTCGMQPDECECSRGFVGKDALPSAEPCHSEDEGHEGSLDEDAFSVVEAIRGIQMLIVARKNTLLAINSRLSDEITSMENLSYENKEKIISAISTSFNIDSPIEWSKETIRRLKLAERIIRIGS